MNNLPRYSEVSYKKINYFDIVWNVKLAHHEEELNNFNTLLTNKEYKETSIKYLEFCTYLNYTNSDNLPNLYLKSANYFKNSYDKTNNINGLFNLKEEDAINYLLEEKQKVYKKTA